MTTRDPGAPEDAGVTTTGQRGSLVALTTGTVVLGACNYLYLALVGNVVGVVASVPVSVLWTMMAGIAVGLFQPVEQMLSRGIARDHDLGRSARPVVRRTLGFAGALLAVALVVLLVAARPIGQVLFSGETAFVGLFAVGLVASTVLFAVRGVLAGTGRFRRYGAELTAEGLLKVAGVGALALGGVTDPRLLGVVLVVSPLIAAGLSLVGLRRRPARSGPGEAAAGQVGVPARATPLSGDLVALGALTTGSLLLQLFVNVGVVLAQLSVGGTATAYTASLVAALAVARVPLFLFNAVQSLLLTRFTLDARRGRFRALTRALAGWNALVLGLGVVWVVLIWLTGGVVLAWFGEGYDIPSGQLVLLAVSCVLQIVTMVLTQAVLAFHRERVATLVWPVGLVVLLGVFGLSSADLGTSLAAAMVAGTAATTLAATAAVAWSIRRAAARPGEPSLEAPEHDGAVAAPVVEQP
ncbi:hypothetical protein F1C15_14205 [Frigoribacterium sp. NBH87]|uniref:hypothetical protein n=1 Tax=Frigoribacterium sp. NBH87 TaxID=2596916 RepID=UPI001625ADB9|nr:hypothetical protein [Frigoribacterium sp. NBH87]QNE44810.1 hypothetical protein F1C15_14205 [Frigoribacterium sp. NBH87]